jgi:DNA repair protein RadC
MGVRKLKQVRQLQEAYQWAAHRKINRAKADNPEAVYALLSPIMAGVQVEQLYILAMDSHAQCITAPTVVSRGDVCGTDAGPRIVFRAALLQGAVQVIIAHNHPSGSITPSAADKNMTTNLVRCGRILDVPLVDHVLIAPGTGFISLRRDYPHLWQ